MRKFLSNLLATITGTPRYFPEIIWADNLWTHNIFRFYEMIFGRRDGVWLQLSSYFDGVNVIRTAHTFEGACALFETWVRNLSKVKLKIIWVPQLVLVQDPFGQALKVPSFLFAIALDNSGSGVQTGFNSGPSTISYSETCTGSNLLFTSWIAIWQDTGGVGTVSSISYNSVGLSNTIASFKEVNMAGEMWHLVAPATGAHTFSVTVTGAVDGIRVATASFTGVVQSSTVGVTNTAIGTTGNPAVSITTGTANSVAVAGLCRFANTAITATTFTNIVKANANNVTMAFDYNLNTTATTYTDTETGTAAQDWVMGVAEFKPFVAASVNSGFLNFM